MIKNDDPIKMWEQDGDLEKMRRFFTRITEDGRKEKIKQLVLAKLAQERDSSDRENSTADPQLDSTRLNKNPLLRIWLRTKQFWQNSWQRWRWKMTLPVAALVLVVVIGQQGLLHNNFFGLKGYSGADTVQSAGGAGMMSMDGEIARNTLESKEMAPTASYDDAGRAVLPPVMPVPEAPPADKSLPRKITHNLYANIQVTDIETAVERLTELAASYGGYIVDSQINNYEHNAYARISMKIPADQFDGVRGSLKEVGKVLNQHLRANDITNQYYDAETRLRNWQAQEQRYLEILQEADTVGDIIQVESALSNIRMQIEQLQGQLKLWDHEVAYSTLEAELHTKESPVTVNDPWQPISLQETWKACQDAVLKSISSLWNWLNYLVVGIGYALPVLIILGIAYPLYRRRKKRKTD